MSIASVFEKKRMNSRPTHSFFPSYVFGVIQDWCIVVFKQEVSIAPYKEPMGFLRGVVPKCWLISWLWDSFLQILRGCVVQWAGAERWGIVGQKTDSGSTVLMGKALVSGPKTLCKTFKNNFGKKPHGLRARLHQTRLSKNTSLAKPLFSSLTALLNAARRVF